MQITIRMDDITPQMDWERFYSFKAILDEYQIKPLLGIVPDNYDTQLYGSRETEHPEFWSYMRELQKQGWVLAMHGYRHIYATQKGGLFPLNNFSEFAGLPLARQRAMIADGKRILNEKGIMTDLFMAPAHSYDRNTLKALKEAGFTRMTDGFGKTPYQYRGMTFYPISFKMSSSLKQKKGATTMVIHAATMTDEDMQRVRGYLAQSGDTRWISYEDYLAIPGKKRTMAGGAWEYVLAKLKFYLVRMRGK